MFINSKNTLIAQKNNLPNIKKFFNFGKFFAVLTMLCLCAILAYGIFQKYEIRLDYVFGDNSLHAELIPPEQPERSISTV